MLCRHLAKRYGRIEALRDLTLTVPAGKVFGLLGQNGAGKSTAIRILATLSVAPPPALFWSRVARSPNRRNGFGEASATCPRTSHSPAG